MRADRKANRFYRAWILFMWVLPLPFLVILSIEQGPFLLIVLPIWSVPIWMGLSYCKKVILTEEGIYAYALFKNKVYPWKNVIQAGVLHRMGRWEMYNQIVLVKQGGSLRRYKDWTFLLRNMGKVIYMDDNPEVRQYVRKYYGLLDFDLADGKKEKSQVDEELSNNIEQFY